MGKQAVGGGFTGPGGMKLPFPKAVRAGDFVFVSGQMSTDANGQLVEGGIEVQTRQVMDNIKTSWRTPAAPWRTWSSAPAGSTVRATSAASTRPNQSNLFACEET